MRFPGNRLAGTRVTQMTRTVDFAPTLLRELGLPIPASYEGVPLQPALQEPPQDLELPAFAETCYLFYAKKSSVEGARTVERADETLYIDPTFRKNFVLKEKYHQPVLDTKDRMIRTDRWKLIWIPGIKGPILRLYDMHADPQQQNDLSGRNLPVMKRLFEHLKAWWNGRTDLRWSREDDDPNR